MVVLSRRYGTAFWLSVLALLLIAFWLTILVFIPMQRKKFDEFAVQLPPLTKTVLDISMLATDRWWFLIPVSFVVVLGGFAIGRYGLPLSKFSHWYAMAATFILLGLIGIEIVALVLPWKKIAEGLAQ